jgi:UDP-GlcNAc3NAcA epimerase
LAGALAAIKLHVPVAHVEAGLRSFNREMPEEINRVLTDNIASKLFAPTATAVKNLAAEGITGERVCNVGDVMYDAALYYGIMAEKTSRILDDCGVKDKSYILATLHRQENVDNRTRLANILIGLSYSDKPVIMPLHPRTRKRLLEFNLTVPSIIKVIDPIGYLDMVMLQKHASLIATDSGGLQKEAYFHKIPCITLRDETEWVELVELGVNLLVGADAALIANSLNYHVKKSCYCENFYGTGQTGTAITSNLVNS